MAKTKISGSQTRFFARVNLLMKTRTLVNTTVTEGKTLPGDLLKKSFSTLCQVPTEGNVSRLQQYQGTSSASVKSDIHQNKTTQMTASRMSPPKKIIYWISGGVFGNPVDGVIIL